MPLIYPTTLETEYFGGIDRSIHMIGQQVSFLDFGLFLRRKLPKNFTQHLAQFLIQNLPPILRNKNHVIFAVPGRVV